MCHKYHVKHISKQCNVDRSSLKSGSKRDTNETPTCAVPVHDPGDGFLVPGLLCRHTASNPITAEMHTSGVQ